MSAAVSLAAHPVLPIAPEPAARKGGRDGAYLRGYVYLVGANLGAKGAGVARELAIAALFGTSPALGLYVLLKSGLEAASVTATGAFQLSLVPRLVRLARERGGEIDTRALFADALRVGALAAALSVTAMLGALTAAGHAVADVAVLSVLLSLSLGLLLVGVVGMVGHQAGGRFGRMSGAFLLTAVIMAGLVYPLGSLFGIEGLALTWLVAVAAQAVVVWRPALRDAPRPEGASRRLFVPALLKAADFKPAVLVAGNQMVLSLIVVRLLASLGGLEAVAVVNYALVLSGLFVTTVARNMSSVVLKASADGLSWRRFGQALGLQLALCAALYGVLAVGGETVVRMLFERGAFGGGSTAAVYGFLMRVFPAFALVGGLDLLVAFVNGRGLAVAGRLSTVVSGLLVASLAVAWGVARWGGVGADVAPLVFVGLYGVAALTAAGFLLWRNGREVAR